MEKIDRVADIKVPLPGRGSTRRKQPGLQYPATAEGIISFKFLY